MARLSQSAINRQQHIPQHVQQAINQHLQTSMPGNLKRYMSGSAPIPIRARKAIAEQMQKTMPAHLKQYSGAYMEQKVLHPNFSWRPAPTASPNTNVQPHPPVPSILRQDRSSFVPGEQAQARLMNNLFTADTPKLTSTADLSSEPSSQIQSSNLSSPTSNYDFFLNPSPAPRHNLLGGNTSFKKRLMLISAGGLSLIVIALIFSSLFSGKSSTTGLLSIAQQQNELIAITNNASTQIIQQTTKNVNTNIQLSLTTDQMQLLNYMKQLGQKASTQQLSSTQSTATNQLLNTAQASDNYDAVYLQIIQSGLTKYTQSLKQTFSSTSSPTVRQLLNTEYQNGNLLLSQTNSAITALNNS